MAQRRGALVNAGLNLYWVPTCATAGAAVVAYAVLRLVSATYLVLCGVSGMSMCSALLYQAGPSLHNRAPFLMHPPGFDREKHGHA